MKDVGRCPRNPPSPQRATDARKTFVAPEIPFRPHLSVDCIVRFGEPERCERSTAALGAHLGRISRLNQKELRVFRRELLFESLNKLFPTDVPDSAFLSHLGVKNTAIESTEPD